MTYVTTADNMPAFLTTDRLRGFARRPLRIPHQGDRIQAYGSLKLLHRLFGRIFLKMIVTTNDLCDDSGQHVCLPNNGWTTGLCTSALRIPHQGDRIRTYGSLKLHRLFGRIFLKRIVTTDDLCDDSRQHACLPDHG